MSLPGDLVIVNGQKYVVAANGVDLTPLSDVPVIKITGKAAKPAPFRWDLLFVWGAAFAGVFAVATFIRGRGKGK